MLGGAEAAAAGFAAGREKLPSGEAPRACDTVAGDHAETPMAPEEAMGVHQPHRSVSWKDAPADDGPSAEEDAI